MIVQANFEHADRRWLALLERNKAPRGRRIAEDEGVSGTRLWTMTAAIREWVPGRAGQEDLEAFAIGRWDADTGRIEALELVDVDREVPGLAEAAARALLGRTEPARWLEDFRLRAPSGSEVGVEMGPEIVRGVQLPKVVRNVPWRPPRVQEVARG